MTSVWIAYRRIGLAGEDTPGDQRLLVGVYMTRELALEHCWPEGDPRMVEEREVAGMKA